MCDESFRDALDHFHGPVWASHSNCRALVPHGRQFTDDHIRELVQRDAVIGAAFDAWMLVPGWVRGESTPDRAGVTLETVVNHIDHICQIAGQRQALRHRIRSRRRVRTRAVPVRRRRRSPISRRLPALLAARGYSHEDVELIAHGNFLRFLRNAWR